MKWYQGPHAKPELSLQYSFYRHWRLLTNTLVEKVLANVYVTMSFVDVLYKAHLRILDMNGNTLYCTTGACHNDNKYESFCISQRIYTWPMREKFTLTEHIFSHSGFVLSSVLHLFPVIIK